MRYLVDTNVLLRYAYSLDPQHPVIRTALESLRDDGHDLQAAVQNYVELWNVSTRPANRNGLGQSIEDANATLQRMENVFPLLPSLPTAFTIWRQLVVKYSVSGVQVHDAHLVATMLAHGVTHILTLNVTDFLRYEPEGITIVDPKTIHTDE